MTHPLPAVILADFGSLLLLPIVLLPFVLGFAFWIWMIVDCAKYETEGNTKIVWLLVILLAGVVGAPLYFFIRKVPRQRSTQYQPPPPVYQPWQKEQIIK